MYTMIEVNKLIKRLNLQPHPEGGFYARNYQSEDSIKLVDSARYNNEIRRAGSSIYYLLSEHDFSAWHTLKSDEIWHYYIGSSVKIHIIDREGNYSMRLLGNSLDNVDASFQFVIPSGNWFAAEIVDKTSYSLVGCTVNPGFEFNDFTLADRDTLSVEFPQHRSLIMQFTR